MSAGAGLTLQDLNTIHLDHGAHRSREDGVCLMEAVAWFAGRSHTDAPPCVSPVLRTYGMGLNDRWGDEQRQKLVPFIPRVVGTAGDGQDKARSYLALDWLIRTFTPAWLDLAGLSNEAAGLRALRRVTDLAAAHAAGSAVRNAQTKAGAAGAAAGAAAWAAAWDAVGDAVGDAAGAAVGAAVGDAAGAAAGAAAWAAVGAAAGDAAGAAAGAAAWAAAWDAVGDAAGDAAGAAVGAAAGDAAGAAAGDAAGAAAWAAARAAARDALQPTVETLQAAALDLFDQMIDPAVSS